MTEQQARRDFCSTFGPSLPARDRPALREAWSNYIDALHRDRQITDSQVQGWTGPERCPRPRRRRR